MSENPLWSPDQTKIDAASMTKFMRWVEQRENLVFANYAALYDWSVCDAEAFWLAFWDYCDVRVSERGDSVLLASPSMLDARWFPDARLNYAENLLRHCGPDDDTDALVFRGEDQVASRLSRAELVAAVSRFAQALRAQGVGEGDRVSGYLPNLPEAMVAMLATASLGASRLP